MTPFVYSEDEFDAWLEHGFSRHWPTHEGPAWMGHRVVNAHHGFEMLLARVPVEACGECVYGEFRPSNDITVLLKGSEALLLTFFIEGEILGFDGAPSGAALPFAPHSILLRRPNEAHGSRITVSAGQRVRFLQLRLPRDQWMRWMRLAGMAPTDERLQSMEGRDGAVIYSTHWTASTYSSLQPWGSISHLRQATLPFLRAKALELLTLFSAQWASGHEGGQSSPSQSQLGRAAHALVHADMAKPWLVSQLCKTLRCSVRALNHSCQSTWSLSASGSVRAWKLEHAKSLLQSNEIMVSDAAAKCGYVSGGRFAALYKKRFGHLPSNHRLMQVLDD